MRPGVELEEPQRPLCGKGNLNYFATPVSSNSPALSVHSVFTRRAFIAQMDNANFVSACGFQVNGDETKIVIIEFRGGSRRQ